MPVKKKNLGEKGNFGDEGRVANGEWRVANGEWRVAKGAQLLILFLILALALNIPERE
jgi:hypothetical protein